MTGLQRLLLSRFALSAAGLLVFGLVCVLYFASPQLYHAVLLVMLKRPGPAPFTDWNWIPSAVRCWTEGVDVYVRNTCDQYQSSVNYNYSPIWLRLTFLRNGEAWSGIAGLGAAVLFIGSLSILPPPRTMQEQAVRTLALLSSATFLAIERANIDLLMFLMIGAGVLLARGRLPLRLAGYAIIIAAGLLKFYPFVALVIVLRERPSVFWPVAAASVACLAALGLAYHHELAVMAAGLPAPSYYTLQFGAADLPGGLGETATRWLGGGAQAEATGHMMAGLLRLLFIVAAIALAIALSRRARLPDALAEIRSPDLLVAGAAVIAGCFFSGQNVIYRAIFLMLVLPGLFSLSRLATGRGGRAFALTGALILLPLWTPVIESVLFLAKLANRLPYQDPDRVAFPSTATNYVLWLCSELAWWWIIAVLLAVTGSFVVRTHMWAVARRVAGQPAQSTAPI